MPRIVKSCQCNKCNCPNKIKEFGHRYEEENAIVKAEFEHDVDRAESIIQDICEWCEKGQHHGPPKK